MNRLLKTLLGASLLALSGAVAAHAIWLERDSKGTQLYFGEYDEAQREVSPGRLDEIGTPRLFVQGAAVEAKKVANGWRIVSGQTGEIRAEAADMAVKDWRKQGIGIVKPVFFARYADSPVAQKSAAQLDIVPTGKAGEFELSLSGKPLAGVKLVVVAPNGWTREAKSAEDGRFSIDMPWSGTYVIEATHVIPETGEFNGVAYEGRRMRATLSYSQSKGPATFAPAAPDKSM